MLLSLLNVAVLSTVADFPTVCSGGLTADDIHDVPVVPASAAVVSDFNSVPATVGLPACRCRIRYFFKHPCFSCRSYCVNGLMVLLLLSYLLLFAFLLL